MSEIKTFRDGDKWCATLPTFVNLQESEAGFGDSEIEAKLDLMIRLYNGLRPTGSSASTGNSASCGDCECRAEWEDKYSNIFVEITPTAPSGKGEG